MKYLHEFIYKMKMDKKFEASRAEFFMGLREKEAFAYKHRYDARIWEQRVSSEQLIDLEQVTASGDQYGKKYNPMDHNYNSSSQSPTEMQSCCTPGSSLRSAVWVGSTNATSQPPVIENSITTEKCTPQIAVQSDKSWKRSSTHVYISRLIKVLQMPKNKEGSSKKAPATVEHDIFLNERIIEDAKVGFYDFLSLDTKYRSSYTSADINREGHSHEGREQFHSGLLPFSLSPNEGKSPRKQFVTKDSNNSSSRSSSKRKAVGVITITDSPKLFRSDFKVPKLKPSASPENV
ncbi:Unknown protein [Striga hermonthica]|uniref:Uncharacterized protein n=1 Tax=Striga hermonthica TaxID=68872 RepID=A0A9N7NR96_STRHE|nr:Unknown protein [Striga hermonthica]